MQKIKYLISAFLLLTTISFAQGLKIGPLAGYNTFTSPDSYKNDISENGLGFSSNIQYGLKAKLDLILIKAIAFVAYNPLSASGDFNTGVGITKIETESSLLTIGLGAEFGLLPVPGPVKPYIGADILINSFGKVEINGNETNSSFSRYGLGIGAGVEFTALPKIDLDLNVKYNFNNLIGKGDIQTVNAIISEEGINSFTVQLTVLFKII